MSDFKTKTVNFLKFYLFAYLFI